MFDPREGWLRYDGNAESGVGMPVVFATGAVLHDGQAYFPVSLLYGHSSEPDGSDV